MLIILVFILTHGRISYIENWRYNTEQPPTIIHPACYRFPQPPQPTPRLPTPRLRPASQVATPKSTVINPQHERQVVKTCGLLLLFRVNIRYIVAIVGNRGTGGFRGQWPGELLGVGSWWDNEGGFIKYGRNVRKLQLKYESSLKWVSFGTLKN